jgi:hypothetical protein
VGCRDQYGHSVLRHFSSVDDGVRIVAPGGRGDRVVTLRRFEANNMQRKKQKELKRTATKAFSFAPITLAVKK